MRGLERDSATDTPAPRRLAIVGRGRLGRALTEGLRSSGLAVHGPLGRGEDLDGAGAVMLCVPDGEIAAAGAAVPPGPLVGHPSGATPLDALAPHERFALHPLMTVTAAGADFRGTGAAIAGSTPRALAYATGLADALGLRAARLDEADRALYHAAASMASNFLLTLEGSAERLAELAGLERAMLVPLVRATVENWAATGAATALTGPIARGDEHTVEMHRAALADRAPELLALYDVLAERTHALAAPQRGPEVQAA